MEKYLEILKKCPIFSEIADADLLRMLVCLGARVVSFDKKYTVMREGGSSEYIGVVLSGSVEISSTDYYGNRNILSLVGEAGVFGEEFFCAGVERLPITATANEASEIMLFSSRHILTPCPSHCGFHDKLIFNMMRGLAAKAVMLNERIAITSKRTTREKLLAYLTAQARREGKDSFEIPFDRQQLADYLEVDRSGLSSEIGKLCREGVIESRKSRFTLL